MTLKIFVQFIDKYCILLSMGKMFDVKGQGSDMLCNFKVW